MAILKDSLLGWFNECRKIEEIADRQSIFFGLSSEGFSARVRVGGLAIVNT